MHLFRVLTNPKNRSKNVLYGNDTDLMNRSEQHAKGQAPGNVYIGPCTQICSSCFFLSLCWKVGLHFLSFRKPKRKKEKDLLAREQKLLVVFHMKKRFFVLSLNFFFLDQEIEILWAWALGLFVQVLCFVEDSSTATNTILAKLSYIFGRVVFKCRPVHLGYISPWTDSVWIFYEP